MTRLSDFLAFMAEHPQIGYAVPGSDDYPALRQAYIIDNPAVPFAIVRPKSAADVAILVSYAVAQRISITVRSGGHDLFGRCFANGALAIDVRDIDFVGIDSANGTATVGGGVLALKLATELSRHHLATAFGSFANVGYVGWSTHGGYGPFEANYGLGVDQIIGATLVNCDGKVVTADEAMLDAIRGGGGCLGVIVEMTIKTYPLEKVLNGVIVFKASDLQATLRKFTEGYRCLIQEGLPGELGIQQAIVNSPLGKAFVITFVWSSDDLATGQIWLEKIKQLGDDIAVDSVKQTTTPDFMKSATEVPPKTAYGGNCTISVREITDEILTLMGEHLARMPDDPATLFAIHQLRGASAKPRPGSVFGAREPHYMFEFIATTSSPERAEESWSWATAFRDALLTTDRSNLLESTYISLTPPADAHNPAIFGSSWQRLVDIKRRYDPQNVFSHALLQFE
ncbi:D-lactate dehydrogenase [Xylariaceae sp. FL0016]|nr:D-lactate dehydrogenase [Xylariaceae sp. FL0016]